jgi:hypothetical protein
MWTLPPGATVVGERIAVVVAGIVTSRVLDSRLRCSKATSTSDPQTTGDPMRHSTRRRGRVAGIGVSQKTAESGQFSARSEGHG